MICFSRELIKFSSAFAPPEDRITSPTLKPEFVLVRTRVRVALGCAGTDRIAKAKNKHRKQFPLFPVVVTTRVGFLGEPTKYKRLHFLVLCKLQQ